MENCEYRSTTKLKDNSGVYFIIPPSVILDANMTEKRITVFSFFSTHRGLGCSLFFSINNIVKWIGKQPNRHTNGINNKIAEVIGCLEDGGYLTLVEKPNNTSSTEAIFNLEKISQECNIERTERFAVVYLDELSQILNYQNPNPKDIYLNNDIILLVFAYLRMKIYRRRNKLTPEEINLDNKNNYEYDIQSRKQRCPEAYDSFYFEMAEELGLSERVVSKAVSALNELGLIYYETLPRIKYDDKWRTDHTIFCNMYKREGRELLDSGSDYYLSEVENKKRKLKIIKSKY